MCRRLSSLKLRSFAKKLVHACYQSALFLSLIGRADAVLGVKVVECGWPDSRWRSRFLVIGCVELHESKIYTKVEDKLFLLNQSPQRAFFESLDSEKLISDNYYFKVAEKSLNDEDFRFWLRTKTELWESFDVDEKDFLPVGILRHKGDFIVEDGAHRLALRSIKGLRFTRVAVSIWSFSSRHS